MAMQYSALFEAPASHEARDYSHPYFSPELEDEWEATAYSHPYTAQEFEDEWEVSPAAAHFSHPYGTAEMEADRFLPLVGIAAKLAAKKLLPKAGKFLVRSLKQRLPRARQLVRQVVRNVQQSNSPRSPQVATPPRLQTARQLVEQLRSVLSEGESQAAALEAELFGANEFEGELASQNMAHEMALAEVLAAEASHSESESEAQALLNAALPIQIRISGRNSRLRQVTPALLQANVSLVRSLHQQGREGRRFLPAVTAIQRRTIASLQVIWRTGRPITPQLVAQIMAAHAARVLSTPRILGPAMVRNYTIRRGTVAPPRRLM